jgi:hypothetical protein
MSVNRSEGRRKTDRAFRPTLEGGSLESRLLLSKLPQSFFLKHPNIGIAYKANQPPFRHGTHANPFPIAPVPRGTQVRAEVAHGGQSIILATPNGSRFELSITFYSPSTVTGPTTSTTGQAPIQGQIPGTGVIQPQGTVRAYAMSGGRVGIILDGTTAASELTISPLPQTQRKGYAHSFSYGMASVTHILNVGQITVNSGVIGAIEGFHTAELSGPLTFNASPQINSGTPAVDRLAFYALLPGASIVTAGDVNTLDILNGVNLTSGPGIVIGRDLNLLNVGQDLDLNGGASLDVGRFLATVAQPPKGTGTGSNLLAQNQALVGTGTSSSTQSLATYIQGNLNLGTGSSLKVNFGIADSSLISSIVNGNTISVPASALVLVNGSVNATSTTQIVIPGIVASNTIGATVQGRLSNFVARGGFNIPGVMIPPVNGG